MSKIKLRYNIDFCARFGSSIRFWFFATISFFGANLLSEKSFVKISNTIEILGTIRFFDRSILLLGAISIPEYNLALIMNFDD